ncbi:acyl-CoA N-acyltransferase [Hesseltinella vesiculosa]|uniref:N-acetyltransferase 9-like protein n=1 Tax=Hesseltinella vesiculosa TaxID=101127 RepID=A0A1X2GF04_9FUNG|nr:acyl-CoA N-acyltransferase [Hesseltinella vesiculosa]
MKQNENLVLVGSKAILVPYKRNHVEKYHEWMTSPFLQEMTASEPLTLEEEYDMQRSWHLDDNKCTFIIQAVKEGAPAFSSSWTGDDIRKHTVMIGDVNIFLNDPDDDLTFGEIEIMVAEETYRRNGYGLEALRMMMAYAIEKLGLKTFHAKISTKNTPSIELFETKLGFYQVAKSEVFQEVTLEWSISDGSGPSEYGAKAPLTMEKTHSALQSLWASLSSLPWES